MGQKIHCVRGGEKQSEREREREREGERERDTDSIKHNHHSDTLAGMVGVMNQPQIKIILAQSTFK